MVSVIVRDYLPSQLEYATHVFINDGPFSFRFAFPGEIFINSRNVDWHCSWYIAKLLTPVLAILLITRQTWRQIRQHSEEVPCTVRRVVVLFVNAILAVFVSGNLLGDKLTPAKTCHFTD